MNHYSLIVFISREYTAPESYHCFNGRRCGLRHFLSLALFGTLVFVFAGRVFCDEIWEQIPGIEEPDLKEISFDYGNKGVIYVSAAKTLYRTGDNGITWSSVFSAKPGDTEINFIKVFDKDVFICTKNSVFRGSGSGLSWQKIFKGFDDREGNVSHIAFSKDKKICIAAEGGVFISSDNGATWSRDSLGGSVKGAKWVEFMDETICVATEKGVYKNSGGGWKRTFITGAEDAEYDASVLDGSPKAARPVNSITADKGVIFLATDSGIFISEDKGETWRDFVDAGIVSLRIKRILCGTSLYAITNRGIFVFSDTDKLWRNMYSGMTTKEANSAAIDPDCDVWAVTKKGLYKNRHHTLSGVIADDGFVSQKSDILKRFEGEPCINDVQKAAIEYAEVNSGKIKKWRESAGKRAFLPDVSLGLDRYVTDYWHWDSGTNPDTLQKGKDSVSWDVRMTWDMGDLIWNSDQTSIDTRSKLMVELRDDIMNEVTRTYFERRRLQIEIFTSPPQSLKLSMEKELRLQELTADLDALTGNYFSKYLRQ